MYRHQIRELFRENIRQNVDELRALWKAFADGNVEEIEEKLTKTLSNSISVFDTKGTDREKENSYHMFLLGMLTGNADWMIRSNREAETGFADLIIETEDPDAGIIIELKSAERLSELDHKCQEALTQIHEREYDEYLRNDGRDNIWAYGIAFYRKRCRVLAEKI